MPWIIIYIFKKVKKNIYKPKKYWQITILYYIYSMKNPYLSIIIPMHNTAQYIQQCLDSIVVQNGFPNFQVIVIDDGSTDNGLSIVQ